MRTQIGTEQLASIFDDEASGIGIDQIERIALAGEASAVFTKAAASLVCTLRAFLRNRVRPDQLEATIADLLILFIARRNRENALAYAAGHRASQVEWLEELNTRQPENA